MTFHDAIRKLNAMYPPNSVLLFRQTTCYSAYQEDAVLIANANHESPKVLTPMMTVLLYQVYIQDIDAIIRLLHILNRRVIILDSTEIDKVLKDKE